MRNNHITIVIHDPNLFYVGGLTNCLSENFSSRGIHTDFTDSAFNSRAKMFFLAEESLSVANIHYLNRRMSMRPLCVFIIKNSESGDDLSEGKMHNISHYTTLYRNQPVESMLSVIHEQLEQLNCVRSALVQPCSVVSRADNNLTRRETEILRYLARGISNGGVARFLHISEKTVSAHKRNIMCKLNMIRPAELNYWLIQEGWCESIRTGDQFH
ncbi:response regulator transcription factor [Erwinia sp. AnSW2-5]|uniref:response regulator transcription factor n=1 Tax=Erwinia sp. AnSW2-5 TaxID=3367692 RepID=UPI00385A0EC0